MINADEARFLSCPETQAKDLLAKIDEDIKSRAKKGLRKVQFWDIDDKVMEIVKKTLTENGFTLKYETIGLCHNIMWVHW